jgi:hypothetical protein
MVLCLECVSHYALDNGIKVLPNLRLVYVAAWDGVRPFVPASALAASEARVEALERFHKAHDVVEMGIVDFDLQHAAVEELGRAHQAIHPAALAAAGRKP